MSSDESLSTLSKIRQFGLYRTVDARTEEFLKLSRKRQIKQGCACAAISTAVTVSIVIVILLIYEYAISVESSSVQRQRNRNSTNTTDDHPVADRLDRSYFGFDQEYFEEMPLLVNAMQENSYVDPTLELTISNNNKRGKYLNPYNHHIDYASNPKLKPIRRTSPRPFIFEYRSPTPTPFTNPLTYNSRNWIESYRNAERLKNLEQVIKYLEKTINAKFGDLYTLPSSTHIAFSGLYVQPTAKVKPETTSSTTHKPVQDSIMQASDIVEKRKPNYAADPLFTFKPESPGDVNLLADQSLRFSRNPIQDLQNFARPDDKRFKLPMFRPISQYKNGCIGTICGLQNSQNGLDKKILQALQGSSESGKIMDKPKSFSVMLNLFPMQQKRQDVAVNSHSLLDNIYITTSRPKLQFRPKPSYTRTYPTAKSRSTTYNTRYKRPRLLSEKKTTSSSASGSSSIENYSKEGPIADNNKLVLHLNVYPKNKMSASTSTPSTTTDVVTTSYEIYKNHVLTTNIPPISTGDPDSYISTRGVDPFDPRTTPTLLPQATTVYPFLVTIAPVNESKYWTTKTPELRTTNQPEILKFSYEDAKVPSQYLNFGDRYPTTTQTSIRRHSTEAPYKNRYIPSNEDMRELIVKLKNRLETTTIAEEITTETKSNESTETDVPTTTTLKTYVPQINGHYRSLNQNSRNINNWLNGENEKKSRRLEITSATSTRIPYVEIQRKSSKSLEKSEFD